MASLNDTEGKILEAIDRHLEILAKRDDARAGGTVLPREVLYLAEACAWLKSWRNATCSSVRVREDFDALA